MRTERTASQAFTPEYHGSSEGGLSRKPRLELEGRTDVLMNLGQVDHDTS
jgi:hypothetical protein